MVNGLADIFYKLGYQSRKPYPFCNDKLLPSVLNELQGKEFIVIPEMTWSEEPEAYNQASDPSKREFPLLYRILIRD